MQYITRKTAALATLVMGSGMLSVPVLAAEADTDPKVGKTVTITGCVHSGKHTDQVVLVGVTEKSADGSAARVPYAIYWLDARKEMITPLVGSVVDVTGKIVRRSKSSGKIVIDVAPDTELDTKVKIETPSKHAESKAFSGGSDTESSIEVIRPVYHMDVEAVQLAAGESAAGPACK